MSSNGLFINKDGLIWRLSNSEFKYPWSPTEVKVIFSFMSLILFEIVTENNPRHRVFVSWFLERNGLEKIKEYCPLNHELYHEIKKYLNT